MKYYKVKEKYDNYRLIKQKGNHLVYDGILIGCELLTEKEYLKYKVKYVNLKDESFDIININRNNTYRLFGARFEM